MNSLTDIFQRFFPWAIVALAAVGVCAALGIPSEEPDKMHLDEFGQIPVVSGGRVQPLDSVARNTLMIISQRQEVGEKSGKFKLPAIQWLLDVMTSNELFQKAGAENYQVFRIEDEQLLRLFGLEKRPEFYRYSIKEMAPKFKDFEEQVHLASERGEKQRNDFQRKVLELRTRLEEYLALNQLTEVVRVIPPQSAGDEWKPYFQAVAEARKTGQPNPELVSFTKILMAYARDDVKTFNQEVDTYHKLVEAHLPNEVSHAHFEAAFNHSAPFYTCTVLYIFVMIFTFLGFLGWLVGWARPLNWTAFALAVLAVIVHTGALVSRMYIQGRPPVTNLYSSAVFIGWGCVLLGLLLEAVFRIGVGNLVAGVGGFTTSIIAHNLARTGDTLGMMEAVLDTNFWLATHVTIVTFGYAATAVAGLIGLVYILLRTLTPVLDGGLFKILGQMIYGIICFATLLSFTGTVLGGIWADQSWGRFWGWDPKENGALIIVIWNALVLHARWAGLIKQRGMAVLSVVGIMVTAWSWFGTNQLGVGLHSYGFNSALANGLRIVWLSSLAAILLGVVPLGRWWNYLARVLPAVQPAGPAPRRPPRDSHRIRPA
jgi:ABC-type transport system involved in cytochrome c biogenesis permease subunit